MNSAVTAVVGLAVVPAYLRYVGAEAYGLIGFYVTLLTLLQLFDFGLAATVTREVARFPVAAGHSPVAPLVAALGRVYSAIAVGVAITLAALASPIAHHWLNAQALPLEQVRGAIMLAGVALGLRFPAILYQGVLLGAQRLAHFSAINMTTTGLGQLGAVALLAWLKPDVRLFFGWQICASLLLVLWLRRAAWACLGGSSAVAPDYKPIGSLWRYSTTVAGINLIGLCFMQLDKVLLSRMVPLAQYGHYMLATVVTNGLYVVVTPIFNALYPRFSALISQARLIEFQDLYRLMSHLVAALMFPLAMLLIVFGEGIVALWTGNAKLASEVAPVISLLAAGSALHSVMFVTYAMQLAMGAANVALRISLTLLLVQGPLIWLLTRSWGGIGAACAWLLLHVLYLGFGSWATHRRLLPDVTRLWLVNDVGGPLVISAGAGLAGWYAVRGLTEQGPSVVLAGLALALLTSALTALTSARLRGLLYSVWRRQFQT
jgi:O-antigen/teichoic acid export membrane protein